MRRRQARGDDAVHFFQHRVVRHDHPRGVVAAAVVALKAQEAPPARRVPVPQFQEIQALHHVVAVVAVVVTDAFPVDGGIPRVVQKQGHGHVQHHAARFLRGRPPRNDGPVHGRAFELHGQIAEPMLRLKNHFVREQVHARGLERKGRVVARVFHAGRRRRRRWRWR